MTNFLKNVIIAALDSGEEANFFDEIGFTLDDIDTCEIFYRVKDRPHCYKLDCNQVKTYLQPLRKCKRQFTGNVQDGPYNLLLLLKYGDDGENVGKLRRLYANRGCGQLTIRLSLAKDGSCIYQGDDKKKSYDHRYYSSEIHKLQTFLKESLVIDRQSF